MKKSYRITLLSLLFFTFSKAEVNWQYYLDVIQNVGNESLEDIKIMSSCIIAASLYGIAQDQVTYRICPEYFTQGFHKKMMDRRWDGLFLGTAKQIFDANSDSPTIQAAVWGVVASWWMGAILGIPITLASRVGSWPKMTYKDLIIPLTCTMGLTGSTTALAGLKAYIDTQEVDIDDIKACFNDYAAIEGVTDYRGFYIDAHAHQEAYVDGPFWSLGLICYILKHRYDLSKLQEESNKDKNKDQ